MFADRIHISPPKACTWGQLHLKHIKGILLAKNIYIRGKLYKSKGMQITIYFQEQRHEMRNICVGFLKILLKPTEK